MEPFYSMHKTSWRSYYPFLYLFYFNVFCSCAAYALILPSIWSFLEAKQHQNYIVAWVLASFSAGEVIGALSFGFLRDAKSTRTALLLSLIFGMIGSILSTYISVCDLDLKITYILIARFLQGVWNGGEQAVEQSYISEVVADVSKVKALSEINIAGICGYTLGPAIGVGLLIIDMDISRDLGIDEYWSIGVFQIVMISAMIVVNYFKFYEVEVDMRVNRMSDYEKYERPKALGILICLFINFVIFFGFAMQDTITGPLITDMKQGYSTSFNYTSSASYYHLVIEAIISIIGLFIVSLLNEKIEDRLLLIFSTCLGVIGWALFIDFSYRNISQVGFYTGFLLISLEFAMARTATFSVFSKIIGPYPAGMYMGLILGAGCFSRALTPYFALSSLEISIKICSISCVSALILSTLLLVAFWRHCSPHQQRIDSDLIVIDLRNQSSSTLNEPLLLNQSHTD